mmetsp:Transcript_13617/g.42355  ORF Transcript_13617/g.42355 Transcript_13617/m.42355 type:complete len:237 (+) Transcript_13617:369-1079(+)
MTPSDHMSAADVTTTRLPADGDGGASSPDAAPPRATSGARYESVLVAMRCGGTMPTLSPRGRRKRSAAACTAAASSVKSSLWRASNCVTCTACWPSLASLSLPLAVVPAAAPAACVPAAAAAVSFSLSLALAAPDLCLKFAEAFGDAGPAALARAGSPSTTGRFPLAGTAMQRVRSEMSTASGRLRSGSTAMVDGCRLVTATMFRCSKRRQRSRYRTMYRIWSALMSPERATSERV